MTANDPASGQTPDGTSAAAPAPAAAPRVRFRIEVDRAGLVDDYLAFVTDPRPARTEIHAAVLDAGPVPTAVLEQMVLDGVSERQDVEALVTYVLETMQPTVPTAVRWLR